MELNGENFYNRKARERREQRENLFTTSRTGDGERETQYQKWGESEKIFEEKNLNFL